VILAAIVRCGKLADASLAVVPRGRVSYETTTGEVAT
jgi:hypothetical protein